MVPEPTPAARRSTARRAAVVRHVARPFKRFDQLEASGSLALLAATVTALVWATVANDSYGDVAHAVLPGPSGPGGHPSTVQEWVNDGLMTVFFFVVGLEIKREWVAGELRDRRAAATPALAAVGGMVVPAAIYIALNAGGPGRTGWGIPMATDIAFALGVLGAMARRVPRSLVVFLLTLAIVDDLGAILVIALFYSSGLEVGWLLGAGVVLATVVVLQRAGVRSHVPFVALGLVLWWCTAASGVHATLAGVVMAFVTPPRRDPGPVDDPTLILALEHRLHPWTTYLVVPLFALVNAGVDLRGPGFEEVTAVSGGIVVALVVGKAVGIAGGTWLAVRSGAGAVPAGAGPSSVAGVAILGGIGFTVSLFVAGLAFDAPDVLEQAKAGILVASVAAAALGSAVLLVTSRPSISATEQTGTVERS